MTIYIDRKTYLYCYEEGPRHRVSRGKRNIKKVKEEANSKPSDTFCNIFEKATQQHYSSSSLAL